MEIRLAKQTDLCEIMSLFDRAREIMRSAGNTKQWVNGYPAEETITKDISTGNFWLCTDDDGTILGGFALVPGEEPTYRKIYEGAWLDDKTPYATIHRLAAVAPGRGLAAFCFEWCAARYPNLRADTHRDNLIMQHVLTKHGFRYCGIIYLAGGDERLAYQMLDINESKLSD